MSAGSPAGRGITSSGPRRGKRRDPNRFRDRILVRAIERANANRAQAGLPELPEITPHSMRRTWATFAASIGRDPKWIAAQIGHTDPQFTFSVYQQVAARRYIDEHAIWTVMRFADEPAERVKSPSSRASTRTIHGGGSASRRARSTGSSRISATPARTGRTSSERVQ